MSKSLSEKAINLKGKQYVLVADRIIYFNETYPSGCIQTSLISELDAELVVVKATVIPEFDGDLSKANRSFTGYSQAKWGDGFVNKTSALENCETSAVGRALAMMGIGVIDSVASVDEINKASHPEQSKPVTDLTQVKNEVFVAFTDQGIKDPKKITGAIKELLGKETIDSKDEAEQVMKALKEGQFSE